MNYVIGCPRLSLHLILSTLSDFVFSASAKSPKREIKDKIERYVKDGPVDLIVILDDSITAEKFGFNKGQRGAKVRNKLEFMFMKHYALTDLNQALKLL